MIEGIKAMCLNVSTEVVLMGGNIHASITLLKTCFHGMGQIRS